MDMIEQVRNLLWGPVLLALFWGTAIYLTIRLKFIQVIRLPLAIKYIWKKEQSQKGDMSGFAALCTSLATTIGTGNIVGVAVAFRTGGPGALFWMWIAAFFSMAMKYGECCLSVKYRITDENGETRGGPMYYIEKGMGIQWKWLAKLFAFFGVMASFFGCGIFPQVDSVTTIGNIAFHISVPVLSLTLALMTAVVILGGIKSMAQAAEWCVPFMMVFYIVGAICCIAANANKVPEAFGIIFHSAFTSTAVAGGASGTIVVSALSAMQNGVARGVFSNESGLGSAPIAAAVAQTNSCVRQGLVCMTGVFFDTICICTLTGLAILTTGVMGEYHPNGVEVVSTAFQMGLTEKIGTFVITTGLMFFAFASILGWNYYGEQCLEYLTGGRKLHIPYRVIFLAFIAMAPFLMPMKLIWPVADVANACMSFPNLIALLALSGILSKETKNYFKEEKNKKK